MDMRRDWHWCPKVHVEDIPSWFVISSRILSSQNGPNSIMILHHKYRHTRSWYRVDVKLERMTEMKIVVKYFGSIYIYRHDHTADISNIFCLTYIYIYIYIYIYLYVWRFNDCRYRSMICYDISKHIYMYIRNIYDSMMRRLYFFEYHFKWNISFDIKAISGIWNVIHIFSISFINELISYRDHDISSLQNL